jgi:hypothetical protein
MFVQPCMPIRNRKTMDELDEQLAMLLFMHSEGEIDSEDFELLFFALYDEANDGEEFLESGERFDLNNLRQSPKELFRFSIDEIYTLCELLRIPKVWKTKSRCVAPGWEVLCMLLRRFSYPCRLCDLQPMFGRKKSHISEFINELVHYLYETWKDKLFWGIDSSDMIFEWCDAVARKGAPLDNCFGFIDGTVRPICRPSEDQRIVYNGHKRTHAIKFQSIISPCGLIISLYGPVEGRRHDITLYRHSNVEQKLRNLYEELGVCIYGDPAYMLRPWLIAPYKGGNLNRDQTLFNREMSQVRLSVEWGFGKVISLFAFLDYKKNQKILLSPIGKYYAIGVLLTNCHTCINGGITSSYFDCRPPSLEEYLTL